jgi:putative FmdB family regulatory protein
MPLYEYRCHGCGKTFEVIQKFSDEPLAQHEGCGGELERLVSPSALRFKGSGWYVNDYARGRSQGGPNGKPESAPAAKAETKGESKGEGKGEGKAESKAESKAERRTESKTGAKE